MSQVLTQDKTGVDLPKPPTITAERPSAELPKPPIKPTQS
jgi:hypothetical protein